MKKASFLGAKVKSVLHDAMKYACASALGLGLLTAPAIAAFPEKPITLVVTYSPGGEADVQMRLVAPYLEKEFGAPFVVKNVVGAGGQLAWDEMAQAKTDGYTWVNFNLPQIVVQPAVRDTIYTADSLIPLVLFRDDPSVLAVTKDDPITFKELVNGAKEKPGQVPLAVTGKWTQHHLTYLYTKKATGADFAEVNVDGQAEVTRLLLGGVVRAGFGNSSAFYRMQDQTRVIAVAAAERLSTLPDAPTFAELGYPSVLSAVIMGIGVAKGTDPAIVSDVSARLYTLFTENEELRAELEKAGVNLNIKSMDEAQQVVEEVDAAIKPTLAEMGVKIEQ